MFEVIDDSVLFATFSPDQPRFQTLGSAGIQDSVGDPGFL
jgi:hypothetical protein